MERTFWDPGVGETLLFLSVTAACPRAPFPAAVLVVEEVGVTGPKVGRHLVSSKPQHLVSLAPLQAGGVSLSRFPLRMVPGCVKRFTRSKGLGKE